MSRRCSRGDGASEHYLRFFDFEPLPAGDLIFTGTPGFVATATSTSGQPKAAATPSPNPTRSTASPPSRSPEGRSSAGRVQDDPTVITIRHWGRLLEGELFATSASRLEWPVLLRRTHGIDALEHPACHGRMRVI